MKKVLILMCVMSLFLVSAAFAESEAVKPEVTGGEVVGDPVVLTTEEYQAITEVLAELGINVGDDATGQTVEIKLEETGGTAVVTVTYPDGTGTKLLIAYNVTTGKWEAVTTESTSDKGFVSAASPETFSVVDNGDYDADKTEGVVKVSYATFIETATPTTAPTSTPSSGGGGGCSMGTVGGISAVLLLLAPALCFFSRK